MKRFLYLVLLVAVTLSVGISPASAKVLRGKCKVEDGKAAGLDSIIAEAEKIDTKVSDDRYLELVGDPTQGIVGDPSKAKTDVEALAVLQAREVFILVDQSGSMGASDQDPRGDHMKGSVPLASAGWTRWQSARTAAEGLAEVTLALDKNGEVPVYFFAGDRSGKANVTKVDAKSVVDITDAFNNKQPGGSTPLADALEQLYSDHLNTLLTNSESFTVIVLTDGTPDNKANVIKFFKKMVTDHKLADSGRENLAAFSFIQMGDDDGAEKFLTLLDDKLQPELGVDIIDTKKDNYIFGTDPKFKDDCGPLGVLRDAIFD